MRYTGIKKVKKNFTFSERSILNYGKGNNKIRTDDYGSCEL